MSNASYGQFCPLAMSAEVVCTRWTPLILRELIEGSTRFNDLRRGVPRMSPALLSRRLKELEAAGVIAARQNAAGKAEYHLTEAGQELAPFVDALAEWGHRWIESRVSLSRLDPSLLMWDMRRRITPQPTDPSRRTIQFLYPELAEGSRNWWLLVEGSSVDLCYYDPGYEIDLLVTSSLRCMTSVWMGYSSVAEEIAGGRVQLDGDPALARRLRDWLGQHPLAGQKRAVA